LACSQMYSSPAADRQRGRIDRYCSYQQLLFVLLSTFQLSRYFPKQALPASASPYLKTDKETRGNIPEKGTYVPGFVFSKEKPTEVCLLEVAYPSFSAALVLCHRPSMMSRGFWRDFCKFINVQI